MIAIRCRRSPHCGQASTSTRKLRAISCAHRRFVRRRGGEGVPHGSPAPNSAGAGVGGLVPPRLLRRRDAAGIRGERGVQARSTTCVRQRTPSATAWSRMPWRPTSTRIRCTSAGGGDVVHRVGWMDGPGGDPGSARSGAARGDHPRESLHSGGMAAVHARVAARPHPVPRHRVESGSSVPRHCRGGTRWPAGRCGRHWTTAACTR
jgi:hypothetical protein